MSEDMKKTDVVGLETQPNPATEMASEIVAVSQSAAPESKPSKVLPFLENYIGNNFFLFDENNYELFELLLEGTIDEMNATTVSAQMIAFRRAKRIYDDLYYDVLKARLVEAERRPAAEVFFKRATESEGVTGGEAATRVRELVEEAHVQECEYNVRGWEEDGWGTEPINTEAHRKALPALIQIQKLVEANQRGQIASLKEFALLQRILEKKS